MRSSWYFSVPVLVMNALLVGCMVVPKPPSLELQTLDSPPAGIKAKVDHFFPRVLAWYEAVNAEFLPKGRPLIAPELDLARKMGVSNPERVRVAIVETFPMPSDPELLAEAKGYGMGSWLEGGRANGYLIMLKPRVVSNNNVLAHEFVHVSQYERMGYEAFLRRYLIEMEMLGYARSPLEIEAYVKSEDVP